LQHRISEKLMIKDPTPRVRNGRFKEVFVFVTGITPQIVTETIYALALKKPPVYPDELFIITTAIGKQHIQNILIEKGVLKELCAEYKIPKITLNEGSFIVAKDRENNRIEDIRDEVENELMGNLITSFIRDKTEDQRLRLHCSIAGGRKTMSFYMGAALQLFGRPWDRLYHVLVSPEFESNPAFFYKPKKNRVIEGKAPDGTIKKLNTQDAHIHLAELPFIRLRGKLSLDGKGFRELVREGQKRIDNAIVQPDITINLSERIVHLGREVVRMTPAQLMLYSMFLRQKTDFCKKPERSLCLECTDCFVTPKDLRRDEVLSIMAEDYTKIYSSDKLRTEELIARWRQAQLFHNLIRQNISKINKAIREQVKDKTYIPSSIVMSIMQYGGTRYGVYIEKNKLRIE
jgi:CRISPR-associated protein (TIGR02584 family)